MEQFGIVMSMICVLFLAIIGVYVWTFKVSNDTKETLGDIYKSVNSHHQDITMHIGTDALVTEKVCKAQRIALKEAQVSIKEDIGEIKDDIKTLLSKAG